jgi:glycosyltransferase involved in cell wall biosynthesis
MSHNAVSIIIVTWNSMDYIPDCLRSLKNQTFEDFSVTVIDNGSTDGVVHFLRTEYPNVSVLENFKNIGFSKANNKGIQISRSPYVLIMNPDVILDPTCLKHLYEVAEEKTDSASFGPKLLRLFQKDLDPSEHLGGLKTLEKSTVIDSAGLLMSKRERDKTMKINLSARMRFLEFREAVCCIENRHLMRCLLKMNILIKILTRIKKMLTWHGACKCMDGKATTFQRRLGIIIEDIEVMRFLQR